MSVNVELGLDKMSAERVKKTFQLGEITTLSDVTHIVGLSDGLLEEGEQYILTSWNSNTYFNYQGFNNIKVTDHYGADLEEGKEYIIIYPRY